MNKITPYLVLLLLGILLLVGILGTAHPKRYTRDGAEYEQLAENLASHNEHYAANLGEPLDYRMYSKRPFGYPMIINTASLATPALMKWIQLMMVFLLFLVGYELGKAVNLKGRWLVMYSLLFLLNIPLLLSSQFIMADLLLALIIGLVSIHLVRYRQSKNTEDLRTAMFLLGFSVCIKPVMLPLAIVFALVFIYTLAQRKPLWTLLAPALVVMILSSFNYSKTNQFHYSSISTINRAYYNAKLLVAQEYGTDSAEHYISGSQFSTPRSAEEFKNYQSNLVQYSNATILNHKWAYAKLHVLGSIKSVIDPGRFELFTFGGQNTDSQQLTALLFAGKFKEVFQKMSEAKWLSIVFFALLVVSLIKLLAVTLVVVKFKLNYLSLALIMAYFAFIAGPVGAYRFMVPATVPFLVLSSAGLIQLFQLFKKGSKS